MMTSTVTPPRYLPRDIAEARAACSGSAFDWQISVTGTGLHAVAGCGFDAITLPAALAGTVMGLMRGSGVRVPVMADRGAVRWMMFTAPTRARLTVSQGVRAARVCPVPRGTEVRLPIAHQGVFGGLRWVIAPRVCPQSLSWATVVDLVGTALRGADR